MQETTCFQRAASRHHPRKFSFTGRRWKTGREGAMENEGENAICRHLYRRSWRAEETDGAGR